MIVDLSKSQEGELDAILTAKREHPEMKIIAIGGGSRPVNRLFEDNPSGWLGRSGNPSSLAIS